MDEALQSMVLVGVGHLVEMLIILELHGIFGSTFACILILTLSSHWYAQR